MTWINKNVEKLDTMANLGQDWNLLLICIHTFPTGPPCYPNHKIYTIYTSSEGLMCNAAYYPDSLQV